MDEKLEVKIDEIKNIRGILLDPQISIGFKIKNKFKDKDLIFENLKYNLGVFVDNWGPELGSGFVFGKKKLQTEKEIILDSKFKLKFSTIMAINSRVLDRHDVVFKADIIGTYSKDNEYADFSARGQDLEYTVPQSKWKDWYRHWMYDLNSLKNQIGEGVISSSSLDIGVTFADRFKQDLEKFIYSELTSMKLILEKLSNVEEFIEFSKNNIGPFIDENWAVAVLSSALLENVVNLKLEELGEEIKGNFDNRVSKLVDKIKEVDGRDISSLGIRMREKYRGRSIIFHSSHKNRVDNNLAKEYLEFIKEVITSLWM